MTWCWDVSLTHLHSLEGTSADHSCPSARTCFFPLPARRTDGKQLFQTYFYITIRSLSLAACWTCQEYLYAEANTWGFLCSQGHASRVEATSAMPHCYGSDDHAFLDCIHISLIPDSHCHCGAGTVGGVQPYCFQPHWEATAHSKMEQYHTKNRWDMKVNICNGHRLIILVHFPEVEIISHWSSSFQVIFNKVKKTCYIPCNVVLLFGKYTFLSII